MTTTDELYEKLTPIFRDTFDDETLVPRAEMTAADVESWDSLSNIRLIVDIEQSFNISFTSAEITGLANVGALVAVIQRKLAG